MKAKDLTQADVGKWVTLRAKISDVEFKSVKLEFEGEDRNNQFCDQATLFMYLDTILEFTDPYSPVENADGK
jgi:hypothetical protein